MTYFVKFEPKIKRIWNLKSKIWNLKSNKKVIIINVWTFQVAHD